MELYLVRHGIAGVRDPKKWPDDRGRPLTIDGLERMREIARGMRKLGLEFASIIDSGYARARQTSEAITDAYRIDPTGIKRSSAMEPEADPADLIALLKRLKDAASVLIVGHQPHLSRTVAYFVDASDGMHFDFRKGGVARLDVAAFERGGGKLTFLLTPRILRKVK